MSWTLNLIEYRTEINGANLNIGDCFYYNPPVDYDFVKDEISWYWPRHYCRPEILSEYYRVHNAHRPPILVFLPGRCLFCVDSKTWKCEDNKVVYSGGWQVSGDITNLTVTPSINVSGIYHGYITNGQITEDCEGRKYDDFGRVVQ